MYVKRQITVQNHAYSVDVPDACPICHRHSEVQLITADIIDGGTSVEGVFRCGYIGCRNFFLCYYGPRPQSELKAVRPVKAGSIAFTDAVRSISPTFIAIFSEAAEAEQNSLLQIAGPGYRKAFEFLIKDYAKTLHPSKAPEIEWKFSGAVVNEYINDARIQAVAKRSLWLGNDESHYLRKWTSHDITDLVKLIQLTAHWIDIEHLSKDYISSMPG